MLQQSWRGIYLRLYCARMVAGDVYRRRVDGMSASSRTRIEYGKRFPEVGCQVLVYTTSFQQHNRRTRARMLQERNILIWQRGFKTWGWIGWRSGVEIIYPWRQPLRNTRRHTESQQERLCEVTEKIQLHINHADLEAVYIVFVGFEDKGSTSLRYLGSKIASHQATTTTPHPGVNGGKIHSSKTNVLKLPKLSYSSCCTVGSSSVSVLLGPVRCRTEA